MITDRYSYTSSSVIGQKYDRIANWWHENHKTSEYGIAAIGRAISYCKKRNQVLDVGCGTGGRIFRLLENHGFSLTGIDASSEMIALARDSHREATLETADIREWKNTQQFDLIIAWDSIFHLQQHEHKETLEKLVSFLADDGVFIYSLGDVVGNHESDWRDDKFPYGSIGIDANLRLLMNIGCGIRHVELDQYPQLHAFIIVQKRSGSESTGE